MSPQSTPEIRPPTEKRIVVLLDANAWVAEAMLNSFQGRSLIDLLAQSGGKILLPEIVEKEVTKEICSAAKSAADKAANEIGRLNSLTRQEINFVQPSSEDVKTRIKVNLEELQQLLVRNDFTFDHAKQALERILSKLPPCGSNNEQFRDACIWQDCLTYGRNDRIFLVTADQAFYKSRKYENGMAEELQREIKDMNADVQIFPSVGDLYSCLAKDVPERDTIEIARKIEQRLTEVIEESLGRNGFSDARTQQAIHFIEADEITHSAACIVHSLVRALQRNRG